MADSIEHLGSWKDTPARQAIAEPVAARADGWTVVSITSDWATVFGDGD